MKNQHGRSGIKTVLIILLVALVSGALWFILSQNNPKPAPARQETKKAAPTKKSTIKAPDGTAPVGSLEIKEWGITVGVFEDSKGLKYTLNGNVASFRSDALDAVSGTCTKNSQYMARGTANEVVPVIMGAPRGTTFAKALASRTFGSSAQYGEYYYLTKSGKFEQCVTNGPDAEKELRALVAITRSFTVILQK